MVELGAKMSREGRSQWVRTAGVGCRFQPAGPGVSDPDMDCHYPFKNIQSNSARIKVS